MNIAQFANGSFKLAHKDSRGTILSESQEIPHDIFDNTSSPRVFFNAGGSSSDQVIPFPAVINGPRGEYLELQFLHSAAATTIDTSASTLQWNVRYWYRDHMGKLQQTSKSLRIGKRMTLSDSGTIHDPRGWPDDKVNVADVWSPVLRIAPPSSEAWQLWDYGRFVLDGS